MTNCYEDSTGIWRNMSFRERLYHHFSEAVEVDPRIIKMLNRHGTFFDDDWQYKYHNKGKIVIRYPLWANERCKVEHAHDNVKTWKPPLTRDLADYIKEKEGEG